MLAGIAADRPPPPAHAGHAIGADPVALIDLLRLPDGDKPLSPAAFDLLLARRDDREVGRAAYG